MQQEIANFTFQNPTKIVFGKNQIESLSTLIPRDRKVLITYGGGSVKRSGVLDRVREALTDYDLGEFGGIEANPTFETCMQAVELIKKEQFDFILAIGGGSVIDGSKFIAAAAKFEGDPTNIFGDGVGTGEPVKAALPLGTILTLPATASEMNSISVITFKEKKAKVGFSSLQVYPTFSVLDPEMTYTLPSKQLANGVTDSFVHIIEQYLTFPVGGMVQDGFAESLMKTLIKIGPDVVKEDLHDYTLRANYMWTATLAWNGILSTGVPGDWSTHALGHELTVLNDTDHAKTLSAILPAVMTVRKEQKFDKLVQYAENVWSITDGSDEEKIDAAISKTAAFFKSLGMPVTLNDINVSSSDIDFLISQLETHECTAISERGDQTLDVSRAIFEKALELES
ncbi:NADH-dependent alcohol dehydrogenase [Kushneria pakistanensis]|uniref:NADH-dependent alcohol dehydrogenase n=1 Tax=Kushneria pakistanensis TaxID=1508770 RepID=A0ABQ3FFK0_9GAMM|nr:iron-containing alcohol dehydrogenase [Kushneria pakistanensis]GHC22091.1 NADH-dependent alcohol dehydrogenase [Kushneria pakistanensis]